MCIHFKVLWNHGSVEDGEIGCVPVVEEGA